MHIGIRENIHGKWSWPSYDYHAFDAITQETASIPRVLDLMRAVHSDRISHEIIQAGGNAGMFPCLLSSDTQKVWTFEADWVNYRALIANTSDRDANVVAIYGALWDMSGPMFSVTHAPAERDNSGAQYAVETPDGTCPSYAIDDSFPHITPSLMWLDIEGAEGKAIAGAMSSISNAHPIIILEMKGLSARYGMTDPLICEVLEGCGYEQVARFGRDVVFAHRHRITIARRVCSAW